jgi:histone H2B
MSAKGKAVPLAATSGTHRRSKRRNETWNLYVYKVLKQVYPDMGMSKKAMNIMNGICDDVFHRLAEESGRLCKYTNKQTMDSTAIKAAVKFVLPGEIAKHAASEATKALSKPRTTW